MRKPVTLIAGQFGSPHYGTTPYLAQALRLTAKDRPVALYIGTANGDDEGFGNGLSALLESAGAHRVAWPKIARKRPPVESVRAALAEADLVFLGGGDVEAGIERLRDADLVDDLRAAAERGAAFAGMSAGAIMLGQRWIRWPHAEAQDDAAETYACLGIAACSIDTHGEADGWHETRSFAAVRARESGRRARAYAVPSGAALIDAGGGAFEARGAPVVVFAAAPHEKAVVEATLEASR